MTTRHTPRLCIGLPVYNGEDYLAQAIESLLGQSFTDFRLIISDNGSTDRTEEICRRHARRDARVDYRRSAENRGLTWNFNHLVEQAEGEFFKWAAHDDLHAPRCVERCIARLEEQPRTILAYPISHVIDESGTIIRAARREPADAAGPVPYERFRAVLWKWGGCLMLHGVFRLEVLRQTQLLRSYPASDIVLLAELALRGELHEVEEPLFYFRDHAQRPYRRCISDAEVAAWLDPHMVGRPQLRHVSMFVNYLRTIRRVPLPLGQKLRCWSLMAKWFVVRFPTIQDEIRGSIAGPVRRAVRRRTAPSSRVRSNTRAA